MPGFGGGPTDDSSSGTHGAGGGGASTGSAGAHPQRQRLGVHRQGDPLLDDESGLETLYIAPGAPWENGYAESFNSKVRDELLNAEVFGSVLEAKVLAREWRQEYNHVRPHSSLGYRTPAEFGAMCPRPDSAALRRAEDTSVAIDPTLTAPGT